MDNLLDYVGSLALDFLGPTDLAVAEGSYLVSAGGVMQPVVTVTSLPLDHVDLTLWSYQGYGSYCTGSPGSTHTGSPT